MLTGHSKCKRLFNGSPITFFHSESSCSGRVTTKLPIVRSRALSCGGSFAVSKTYLITFLLVLEEMHTKSSSETRQTECVHLDSFRMNCPKRPKRCVHFTTLEQYTLQECGDILHEQSAGICCPGSSCVWRGLSG